MVGRPSSFTQAIADRICERLAEGASLRAICEADDMPARSTVFKWLREVDGFSDQYIRAREMQADAIFDDLTEIADDGRNDWMEKRDADGELIGWRENGESARRSALRVDARKWMLSKMLPKKYGDRLDLNHSGAVKVDSGPDFSNLTKDELAVMKMLLAKGGDTEGTDAP